MPKPYIVYRWPEATSRYGPAIEEWRITGNTDLESVANLKGELRARMSRNGYALGDLIQFKDPDGVQVNAGCGTIGELIR